jgi:stage II sporulation protein D
LLLAFLALTLYYAGPKASGEEAPRFRVRISSTAPLTFQTVSNISIVYQSLIGWKPLEGVLLAKGRNWSIDWEKSTGRIILSSDGGDQIASAQPLRLTPDSSDQIFHVGNHDYSGIIEAFPTKRGIAIYNIVDIESYVAGVLAGESIPGWNLEALKAQAVASRTFALRQGNRHKTYDFCDGTHCQRYVGRTQDPNFLEAVKETQGEVLTYGNKLIWAFYHSNSGGQTENNEDIWGGESLPYLRSVEGYDQSATKSTWSQAFTLSVADLLKKLGMARWQSCEVRPILSKNNTLTAYAFRHPEDGKTVTLTREQMRWKMGFPSPRFQLRRVSSEAIQQAIIATNGGTYRIEKSAPQGDQIHLTLRVDVTLAGETIKAPVALQPAEILSITGVGSGHGVGLSQWGSQTMALAGKTYQEILHHYYGNEVAIVPYKPEYQVK